MEKFIALKMTNGLVVDINISTICYFVESAEGSPQKFTLINFGGENKLLVEETQLEIRNRIAKVNL